MGPVSFGGEHAGEAASCVLLSAPRTSTVRGEQEFGPSLHNIPAIPQRRWRFRLLLLLLWALAGIALVAAVPRHAVTQSRTPPPVVQPNQPSAQPTQAAAPEFVIPSAEVIVILIRSTLLSLNDALRTGNYTVLRDLASPSFRETNNAGRLHEIFSGLSTQRIDLAAVAIVAPKLPQAPNIDQSKRLHIVGYFPGDPVQINFELVFEAVANQWRVYGISVNPAKSVSADAAPPAGAALDQKKSSTQQGKSGR